MQSGEEEKLPDVMNSWSYEEFTSILGNVVEHCPVIAAAVWSNRPYTTIHHLQQEFSTTIDQLPLTGNYTTIIEPSIPGHILLHTTYSRNSVLL